ncbi:putative membrane protein [Marininema mesophilum]|uniref:Putative membrane protein n=1 Tax=Marininema mesophilum TaxID=1048340 RepID=A0A1H3ACZ6_9BACL|nr:YhgE/Pip domain-containing protein [Marininema mesophilum]SDX26739.1 putative membrane protein [Marininema mesophilum]
MLRRKRRSRLALYDIVKHRPLISVMIGIFLVPLIYSGIYLTAFFDPYSKMEDLPVAVVNEDQGATIDGGKLNVGKNLAEKLKKDPKLKWSFVDKEEMREGFKKNRYYLGIVIPKNFSKNAASVEKVHPSKGRIQYYADEGSNYLAPQIGKRAILTLQTKVERELSRTYAEKVFEKMGKSAKDLAKAADGADTLKEASDKAQGATGKLEEGTSKMLKAVKPLAPGIAKLDQGSEQLLKGQKQATAATGQLSDGADQVDAGLGTLRNEVKKVQTKINPIKDIIKKLKDVLDQPGWTKPSILLKDRLDKIEQQDGQIEGNLNQLIKKNPELKDSSEINAIQAKIDEKRELNQSLLQAANQLDSIWDTLRSKVDDLYQKLLDFDKMVDGINKLAAGADKMAGGLDKLDQGQNALLAGTKKLNAGLDEVNKAPAPLIDGLTKIDQGLKKLEPGLGKIKDGQGELADGLFKGVKNAKDALVGKDKKADQMSHPVAVNQTEIDHVPNYASGFAPYFISLSLWVGAMLLFTVLDLKRPTLNDERPLSIMSAIAVAIIQALLLVTTLIYIVGVKPEQPGWVYLFTIVTALTFTSINHLLVSMFKDVGRFLSIILLMLQLASSAGTYPVEMLPEFFQSIHAFLPMSYSVEGLREAVSSHGQDILTHNLWVLIGYTVGAYGLKIAYDWLKKRVIIRSRTES